MNACRPAQLDHGVEPPGRFDHHGRQVDAQNARPSIVKVARDVPRPTAQVASRPLMTDLGREAIQQLPVERLVRKLFKDTNRILLGDPIV